jgi:F-box interacting protein
MLPDGNWAGGEARTARLGFDPAVSSHFHVVEYAVNDADEVIGVEIYSSKTGAWSFKESEWGDYVMLYDSARSVFLNGFMHMLTYSCGIVVVDMEGKTWRSIPVPSEADFGCIHQTQGRLCFINVDGDDASKLSIWILEDHYTDKWTLKHSVRELFLFRRKNLEFDSDYKVITVHPECNLIYFVYGWDKTLALFVWLISHLPAVLFSQNKPATSNQPAVPFSQNKSAPAASQTNRLTDGISNGPQGSLCYSQSRT